MSTVTASAQAPGRAVEFEDLGFTAPLTAGARTSVMGPVPDGAADASVLFSNPACLGRIARIGASASFTRHSTRMQLDYGTGASGEPTETTRLELIGGTLPLPVMRGSLVPAFAIRRVFTGERDLAYARTNEPDDRDENYTLQQSGATHEYSLGLAMDLSAAWTAGFSLSYYSGGIDALEQYDYRGVITDPGVRTFVLDETDASVSGFGGRVGVLLHAHPHAIVGVALATVTALDMSGTRTVEETRYVTNDSGEFTRQTTPVETSYTLPYSVTGTLTVPVGTLIASANVMYQDWANAAIDGRRVRTRSIDPVMRTVYTFGAGIEWSVTELGLRVRAGASRAPSELTYLETDRIDDDALEPVTEEKARVRLAVGAGLLLRGSISVDAAFLRTTGERTAGDVMSDDYRSTRVTVQASYTF